MLLRLKTYIKNNVLLQPMYNMYKHIKDDRHRARKEKGMEKFSNAGMQVMFHTQSLFEQLGVKFFIANGTLLGIIRDSKLIKSDMDIDIIVYLEKNEDILAFRKNLTINGYELLHCFYVDTVGITQETYSYEDILVDVSYVRCVNGKYYPYVLYDLPEQKNKVIVFPFSCSDIKKIKFAGGFINVPDDPELFLEESYGEDWRIPNPNYIYWENKKGIKLDLVGSIKVFTTYKYR